MMKKIKRIEKKKCKIIGFLHGNRLDRLVRCKKKDRILNEDGTAQYIGEKRYIKAIIKGIVWGKKMKINKEYIKDKQRRLDNLKYLEEGNGI